MLIKYLEMGPGGHVLTFPISNGKIMNVVAFHTTEKEWKDVNKNTRIATREDALRDFDGYGPDVTKMLQLTTKELNVVSRRLPLISAYVIRIFD